MTAELEDYMLKEIRQSIIAAFEAEISSTYGEQFTQVK